MYTAICLQIYACMFWHTQGRPDSMKWCVQTSRIVELKHQTFKVCIRARCKIDFFLNEYAPDSKCVGDVNQRSKVGTEIEPFLWQIWQFTWGNYTWYSVDSVAVHHSSPILISFSAVFLFSRWLHGYVCLVMNQPFYVLHEYHVNELGLSTFVCEDDCLRKVEYVWQAPQLLKNTVFQRLWTILSLTVMYCHLECQPEYHSRGMLTDIVW